MADVSSKREVLNASGTPDDIWADFREIEVLNLRFEQEYAHSLGKTSNFFLELENGRLMGTRCDSCAKVFAPPRPFCPDCAQVTQWIELPQTGSLQTFSVMHFGSGVNNDVRHLNTPYVFAYVLLDGASTLFPHLLDASLSAVEIGMRVRAVFNSGPVEHPIHLMRFVPLEV